MSALRSAGAVGASQALQPIRDMLVARRALDYAQGLGMTVHVFAQNAALAAGGCAHEGAVATRLGLPSIPVAAEVRSEEHTSELQSLMRISYAVFCLKKKRHKTDTYNRS